MDLRNAIEHLRKSWLEGYAGYAKMQKSILAYREKAFNIIVDELNKLETLVLDAQAMHHAAIDRALYAEATADLLMEWCVLNGVDHRICLDLAAPGTEGGDRPLQVFRAARMEMAAMAVENNITSELLTPTPERARLAFYLLLKHSAPTAAVFEKHSARMATIAHHAVKDPIA